VEFAGIPSAIQTLLAFAAFVVPGFLLRAGYVRSRAVSANAPSLYVLAEAVVGSLAVLAAAWWWRGEDALGWIQTGTLYQHKDKAYWFFLALLTAPYPAGVLAGWVVNTLSNVYDSLRLSDGSEGFRHKLFYWLEVGGVFNAPTLWDDIWDDLGRKPPLLMLRVTTPTGREVVGAVRWGTWADNSPKPRELFLEAVYRQDNQGGWERIPGHEGMFFHESSIESIEFFRTPQPAGSTGKAVIPALESPQDSSQT
jgi:hypothetical protein